MRSFLPQVFYTVLCLSKTYTHKNICKKTACGKKRKQKEKNEKRENSTDRD
jgi:hypothetical protein